MKWIIISLFMLVFQHDLHAQSKKYNAIIVSNYGDEFRVRLSRVVMDSLYFIATPYNSDSALKQFYLRSNYDEHAINISYLRSVTIKPGRVLGINTLMGLTLFGLAGSTFAYNASRNQGHDFFTNVGNGAIGLGLGALLGATSGFVLGIFSRKKIYINGSTTQLQKVAQYILH
ncbi:MAG: hypothetical protein ABIX01_08350 [Chitinophagaceae bacterium]